RRTSRSRACTRPSSRRRRSRPRPIRQPLHGCASCRSCRSPAAELVLIARGKIVKHRPEVLFVCVHNAGRSQMAAALLDHYAEGRVHVRSAGSTPASEVNPVVVQAMSEIGIDISKEFPKSLTDEVVRDADAVVTMGCGDACPIY